LFKTSKTPKLIENRLKSEKFAQNQQKMSKIVTFLGKTKKVLVEKI